ncbi:nascent polypeptide-associated complex subunit alpha, muscle-specific form-like [Empidonax traillii]|uniref:nascent polypeptide-associated complex subunit alpha, muscle-specific form-like n=1 Tax=Empidonax traillii TaxID=164674 RepID=UPI000FFD0EB8|nr:nascent polypeptide-associated complex subunit alpha, muscle-specific form-like [Empidonax traillii]
MAERANPTKVKANQRRRYEPFMPRPRGAEDDSSSEPASPAPGTSARQHPPPAATRSRDTPQRPRGEPGTASGTQSPGPPSEHSEDSAWVTGAPLTEAGLRTLGRMTSQQRVLLWLEANFPNPAQEEQEAQGHKKSKAPRKK